MQVHGTPPPYPEKKPPTWAPNSNSITGVHIPKILKASMANDFTAPSIGSDFHNLRTPIPDILDIDPSMDHFHFTDMNPTPTTTLLDPSSVILPSAFNFQSQPMSFPEFPGSLVDAFPGLVFHPGEQVPGVVPQMVPAMANNPCESRKRKAPDVSESCSGVSSHSPPASASGSKRKFVRRPFLFPGNIPVPLFPCSSWEAEIYLRMAIRWSFISAFSRADRTQVEQRGWRTVGK